MNKTHFSILKVLSSSTKIWSWSSSNPSIKTKNDLAFLTWSFLITHSLNIDISSKKRLCSTVDLFSVVRVILFNIYKIHQRFYLCREGLKLWNYNILSFCVRSIFRTFSNIWDRAFCWKLLSLLKKRFILDIWLLNKPLIVTIDCNMYYCWKVT